MEVERDGVHDRGVQAAELGCRDAAGVVHDAALVAAAGLAEEHAGGEELHAAVLQLGGGVPLVLLWDVVGQKVRVHCRDPLPERVQQGRGLALQRRQTDGQQHLQKRRVGAHFAAAEGEQDLHAGEPKIEDLRRGRERRLALDPGRHPVQHRHGGITLATTQRAAKQARLRRHVERARGIPRKGDTLRGQRRRAARAPEASDGRACRQPLRVRCVGQIIGPYKHLPAPLHRTHGHLHAQVKPRKAVNADRGLHAVVCHWHRHLRLTRGHPHAVARRPEALRDGGNCPKRGWR